MRQPGGDSQAEGWDQVTDNRVKEVSMSNLPAALQGKECHIKSWTGLLFPLLSCLATQGFRLLPLGGENRFYRSWWESRRGRVRLDSCGNKYPSVSFV